jgi:hypothetical protein
VERDVREEADERLNRALAETGARDPREPYRALLRELKGRSQERYERAVERFQDSVLPSIARERADPLLAWLEYGCDLAERLDPGRDVVVDASGRAAPLVPPPSWRDLILHVPDEDRARAIPICLPPELTAAQRATLDLLVHGKVRVDG